jgi:hypothetical protein
MSNADNVDSSIPTVNLIREFPGISIRDGKFDYIQHVGAIMDCDMVYTLKRKCNLCFDQVSCKRGLRLRRGIARSAWRCSSKESVPRAVFSMSNGATPLRPTIQSATSVRV